MSGKKSDYAINEEKKLLEKIKFTEKLAERADQIQLSAIKTLRNILMSMGKRYTFTKENAPSFCPTYHQQGIKAEDGLTETSCETVYKIHEAFIDSNNNIRFVLTQYRRSSFPIRKHKEVMDSKGHIYEHEYWVPGDHKDNPKPYAMAQYANAYGVPMSAIVNAIAVIKESNNKTV